MKKLFRKFFCLFLLLSLTTFSACRLQIEFSNRNPSVLTFGSYSLKADEISLLALQYKVLYERTYEPLLSGAFWDMKVSDDRIFSDIVKENFILPEGRAILHLRKIAEGNGIILTESEKETVFKKAETIFNKLSEDEIQFASCNLNTVYQVLSYYRLAEKTIDFLLRDKVLEVSSEEARVIDTEVIHTTSEEKIQKAYERLKNGENFRMVALETTDLSFVSFSFSRSDILTSFHDALFSLSEGEFSEPLSLNNEYYLFHVLSSYNSVLSKENQADLLLNRRYKGWEEAVISLPDSENENMNQSFFRALSLNKPGDFPYFSLFDGGETSTP